jgi:hypothetical protein
LKKRLTLAATAKYISRLAIGADLAGVTGKCSPTFYLNAINMR